MMNDQHEEIEAGEQVRLNRYLAMCGVTSRRKADELIKEGSVTVDGELVTEPGTKVVPGEQKVSVDGRDLSTGRRYYYLLNKPKGVVCTSSVREGRPRAIDMVPRRGAARLFCVGRLDEDSEGLLLVTNDGDFANRIAHPRYGVFKTYSVLVRGQVGGEDLQKLKGGVWLSEGKTAGARILVRRRTKESTSLLVTLEEGRNREIRRIFAKVGVQVKHLKRVRIGNLTIHKLRPGACRPLTRDEIEGLLAISSGKTIKKDRKRKWTRKKPAGRRRSGRRG